MLKLSLEMLVFNNNNIETLHDAIIKIVKPVIPQKIYETIVNEAVGLINADYGSIFIIQDKKLKRVYSSVPRLNQISLKRADGFTIHSYKKKEIYILEKNDIQKIDPEMLLDGTKSVIVLPLAIKNKSLGILTIKSKRTLYFDKRRVNILKLFASVASIKIRNSYLREQTTKQLKFRKEFSAIASHELKTPLTTVSLYTQLLKKKLDNNTTVEKEWFTIIETQIDKMTNIINEFLTTKGTDKNKFIYKWTKVKPYILLKQIVNTYKIINPTREIIFSPSRETKNTEILADRHKLSGVFVNILNNSIKFSMENTLITIEMKTRGNHLLILFKDEGSGISKKDMDFIFEPFFKGGKIKKPGSGMGLYLAKNIIKAHNGSIDILSTLGIGTKVKINLPLLKHEENSHKKI